MEAIAGVCSHDDSSVEAQVDDALAERAIKYRNQAVILSLQGHFAESESCSREALRLRPDDVDILNELGVALWRQGRFAEAEAICQRACEIDPNDFRVLTNLGLALHSQGKVTEAGESYRRALENKPDAFEAVMNLGIVYSDQGKFEEAAGPLERALELRPESADALQNIGMNLGRQARWHEAVAFYDAALKLKPEFPEVHRNLAYALLCSGDYERGWPEHEWRLKCKPSEGHRINRTFWNGDDFRERSLLVHAEQGFGDTLQFIRYTALVKRRGGQVMLLCPGRLLRLLARCEGVDLAFDATSYIPECHLHVPMLSLPAIFGTTIETVPAEVPYLVAEATVAAHWQSELAQAFEADCREPASQPGPGRSRKPFLIGVAWQGNPSQKMDNWRSFPLKELAPIAALPGVRLVNVQVEHGLDQLRSGACEFPVIDLLGPRKRDFAQTAALLTQLDLIIAPDTAMAHLAGGLGRPVWVALCSVGDWRYPVGRNDTPWYPTMRLFRQTKLGNWEGVFRQMRAALEQALASDNAAGAGERASTLARAG
jgi:Flp pilus assembly protein TadD